MISLNEIKDAVNNTIGATRTSISNYINKKNSGSYLGYYWTKELIYEK